MSRLTIYFAHPMSDYGSDREKRAIDALELAGFEVVNPNSEEHERMVQAIRQGVNGDPGEHIMRYFCRIACECEAIAFQAFPQGNVGAGVAKEVHEFVVSGPGGPVFEVLEIELLRGLVTVLEPTSSVDPRRVLSVAATRELLRQMREA